VPKGIGEPLIGENPTRRNKDAFQIVYLPHRFISYNISRKIGCVLLKPPNAGIGLPPANGIQPNAERINLRAMLSGGRLE
jgi:hypothetical protein